MSLPPGVVARDVLANGHIVRYRLACGWFIDHAKVRAHESYSYKYSLWEPGAGAGGIAGFRGGAQRLREALALAPAPLLWFCHACGERWPRDPRLEVECPQCKAPVGVRCKKPSGHRAWKHEKPHLEREQLAMDRGLLHKCPAAFDDVGDVGAQLVMDL